MNPSYFLVNSCFQMNNGVSKLIIFPICVSKLFIFPICISKFTFVFKIPPGLLNIHGIWGSDRQSWSFIHKLLRLNGLWIQSALIELVSARLSPIRFTKLKINCRLRTIFKLTTLSQIHILPVRKNNFTLFHSFHNFYDIAN